MSVMLQMFPGCGGGDTIGKLLFERPSQYHAHWAMYLYRLIGATRAQGKTMKKKLLIV